MAFTRRAIGIGLGIVFVVGLAAAVLALRERWWPPQADHGVMTHAPVAAAPVADGPAAGAV